MRGIAVAVLVSGIVSAVSWSASAQLPQLALADSASARADSLMALAEADHAVRANIRDPEAWHRLGILAWRLANAEKRVGFMKREANDSLLQVADSSLRTAIRYSPDSPAYLVDLGRFYLTSNSAGTRSHANGLFERALKVARKAGDSVQVARASDEMGMMWWRRYEDRADRHIYSYIIQNVKDRTFTKDPRSIAYFIDRQTIRAAAQDWSGQSEYLSAQEYFADAVRADPANDHALRHMFMLLVDRQRWVELQHLAQVRLLDSGSDAWAWLGLGLAAHRLGDEHQSELAFDSALKYLPESDRRRYDHIARIVTPKDSLSRARLPDAEQANDEEMYWLMADPLWSTPDNEHRNEFLSRVTYAELRFSVEEFGIHGADTDRGDVFIRYGPPPAVISFPPDPRNSDEHRIRVLWWYSTDEAFLFRQLPTYSVSTLDPGDARELHHLRDTVPVVWLNAGNQRLPDSINVQLVRFRSSNDSSDVWIAAELPIEDMIQGVDLARGPIKIDFAAYSWRAQPVYQKTLEETVDFRQREPTQIRSWRMRMRPGAFLYRVEAFQPDAGRGARAASRIDVLDESGFGMSDLLIADQVTPKPGSGGERWSDFLISPNLGRVKRGSQFALLWETYNLHPVNGNDQYRVSITLHRIRGGGLGAVVAKIVGGVANAIGLTSSGQDKVSFIFPREVAAQPIVTDYLTLDVGSAPAGQYVLDVDITDVTNGQHVSKESGLTIVE